LDSSKPPVHPTAPLDYLSHRFTPVLPWTHPSHRSIPVLPWTHPSHRFTPVGVILLHCSRLQYSLHFYAYTLAMQSMVSAFIQHPFKHPSRYIISTSVHILQRTWKTLPSRPNTLFAHGKRAAQESCQWQLASYVLRRRARACAGDATSGSKISNSSVSLMAVADRLVTRVLHEGALCVVRAGDAAAGVSAVGAMIVAGVAPTTTQSESLRLICEGRGGCAALPPDSSTCVLTSTEGQSIGVEVASAHPSPSALAGTLSPVASPSSACDNLLSNKNFEIRYCCRAIAKTNNRSQTQQSNWKQKQERGIRIAMQ
jgi:hypothetical protein